MTTSPSPGVRRALPLRQGEKPFKDKVLQIVREVPRGKTRTYGEVAFLAGRPGAARAVGTIMSNNFDPSVPCHRVVRADGKLGDYNRGGGEQKRAILERERQLK